MYIISNIISNSFREKLSIQLVESLKPLYFILRKERKPWNIDKKKLSNMPKNTLGYDMYRFLENNQLEIMPRAEFHDVYHVLFDFNTSIHDETCIQFIPLGNGKYSLPFIISTFVSGLFFPEYWNDYIHYFQKGKKAKKFYDWDFEKMLLCNTNEIREAILGKD